MYLRDYLQDIPLKSLNTIAENLGIKVEYRARIKLINAIDRAFWKTGLVEELIEKLPSEKRLALSLIAFSFDSGLREKVLVSRMEKLTGLPAESTREIVHSLIPYAVVGGIREEDTLYFCPGGIGERVRANLLGDTILSGAAEGGDVFSSPELLEDIFSFLAELYRTNASMTLSGNLKKNVLSRIFLEAPVRHGMVRLTPDFRENFILNYCLARCLVSIENRTACPTPALGGWLELSPTARMQDVVTYSLDSILNESFLVVTLTGLFGEINAGGSFKPRTLAAFLNSMTAAAGTGQVEPKLRVLMGVLSNLGLFSYKQGLFTLTFPGERLFKGEKLPFEDARGDKFTVQPNFEVIAGPELEPQVRFFLELLSTRSGRDTVSTYVITQKGIARARERGMSTFDILNFFDRHSRTSIPQNIRFTLESWAGAYGNIFFEKAILMRFRDRTVATAVINLPDIEPYLHEKISDNVIAVSSHHVPWIINLLKKNGFLPEPFGEASPDPLLFPSEYFPETLSDLIEKNSQPPVQRTFIFPHHFSLGGENEDEEAEQKEHNISGSGQTR